MEVNRRKFGLIFMFVRDVIAHEGSVAAAEHIDMGNAGFEELVADDLETQALIERGGMNLGGQFLLRETAALGFGDDRSHECITDIHAAPVAQYRYPSDLPISQQPGGTNRVITFKRQEMNGFCIISIPLLLGRNSLLGNENRLADTP